MREELRRDNYRYGLDRISGRLLIEFVPTGSRYTLVCSPDNFATGQVLSVEHRGGTAAVAKRNYRMKTVEKMARVFARRVDRSWRNRLAVALQGVSLDGVGLEIAPYFEPLILKREYDVLYADHIDNREIQTKAAANPGSFGRVPPAIDFVWASGRRLRDCAPAGLVLDYIVASHVIEHVPDAIGWLLELFEMVRVGGRVILLVPDRRHTMDYHRRETSPADLIDAWFRRLRRPSPAQIFDFASRNVDSAGKLGTRSFERGVPFEEARRHYTDADALRLATHSWASGEYLDIHCTVWTPASFVHAMVTLAQLGIINMHVCDPVERRIEFAIHLIKQGEPAVAHPGGESA
ncbi:MAG: methyltransferase domain-containing protein [Alphaproteobacteria bacterium]|nr:methyltransferase domain-containing protein [Alphaproteobacteria bacterium]